MKKKILQSFLILFLIFCSLSYAQNSSEHDAIVLLSKSTYNVEADGSFIKNDHLKIKVLTDAGIKELRTLKLPYHRRYNEIIIKKAAIIKKDGTVIKISKKNITDTTMAETQMMNIYEENFRVLNVEFPSLDKGDTIEYEVILKSKPLIKNNFTDIAVFQSYYPVKKAIVELKIPKTKNLRWKIKNGKVSFRKKLEKRLVTYIWEGENIPEYEKEMGMVPVTDSGLYLIMSTFKDWKELSDYGDSLNKGKIDKNEKMVKLVKELIKDKKTEKDKILSIFRWVSQNIRYMGSSMDVGAFIEPHKATYTFEKKFGVCRDKSILMISMLKIAGIEAEDVLINITRRTDPDIPVILFEHAIVAVKYKGRYVYMDPTLELSTDFGESYTGGRYVLHLVEGGKPLVKVPEYPPEKSLGKIFSDTKISSSGDAITKINVNGKGYYDFVLRTIGKQLPGKKQTTLLWSKIFNIVSSKAEIIEEKFGNPTDLNKNYSINYTVKYPKYLEEYGNIYMFKIPQAIAPMDLTLGYSIYTLTRLPERKHPLNLFSPMAVKIEERIILDKSYRIVSYPDEFEYKSDAIDLLCTVKKLNNTTLLFSVKLRMKKAFINPDEYQNIREAIHKFEKFKKMFVIVKKEDKIKWEKRLF